MEEIKSKKKEVQKAFPNANNPTFIKMVDIKKSECENRKDSKSIIVNDNGINKSINLDYFILQSKDLKKLKEKSKNDISVHDNINNNNIIDPNTTFTELFPSNSTNVNYDYEYIIYVRPNIIISNKTPFPINITLTISVL